MDAAKVQNFQPQLLRSTQELAFADASLDFKRQRGLSAPREAP